MCYQKPFLKGTPHDMRPVDQEKTKIERKVKRNKNMRIIRLMKAVTKVHEDRCDGSGLMLNINKTQETKKYT